MRHLSNYVVLATTIAVGFAALAMLPAPSSMRGGYSLHERVEQYGPDVANRLARPFSAAGVAYPPHAMAYVAFKDTRLLEVYGKREFHPTFQS